MSHHEDFYLAGVPDAFQRLWTPHRMVYIDGENKPSVAGRPDAVLPCAEADDRDG